MQSLIHSFALSEAILLRFLSAMLCLLHFLSAMLLLLFSVVITTALQRDSIVFLFGQVVHTTNPD